jgi:hypothetical protein
MRKHFSRLGLFAMAIMLVLPFAGKTEVPFPAECVKGAIDARTADTTAAWTKYSTTMTTLISTRDACMKDAITQASQQADTSEAWLKYQELAKPCVKTFATGAKQAIKTFNKEKRAGRLQYTLTMKRDCRGPKQSQSIPGDTE